MIASLIVVVVIVVDDVTSLRVAMAVRDDVVSRDTRVAEATKRVRVGGTRRAVYYIILFAGAPRARDAPRITHPAAPLRPPFFLPRSRQRHSRGAARLIV